MLDLPPKIADLAWAKLVQTGDTLQSGVDQALKKRGFPPMVWFDVLNELSCSPNGALDQGEVKTGQVLAQYNFVRLLDRLERSGLITRAPSAADGRAKVLRITGTGRDLQSKMVPVRDEIISEQLSRVLQSGQVDRLMAALTRLQQTIA